MNFILFSFLYGFAIIFKNAQKRQENLENHDLDGHHEKESENDSIFVVILH